MEIVLLVFLRKLKGSLASFRNVLFAIEKSVTYKALPKTLNSAILKDLSPIVETKS